MSQDHEEIVEIPDVSNPDLGGAVNQSQASNSDDLDSRVPNESEEVAENEKASQVPKWLIAMKDWFFTSRIVPTIAQFELSQHNILITTQVFKKAQKDATQGANNKDFFIIGILKGFYLRAIGLDGYDHFTKTLTCADGGTGPFSSRKLTLTSFLLSLFALPSRPMSLDKNGYPQYSFRQLLYSFAGTSWNPIKETVNGEKAIQIESEHSDFEKDDQGYLIFDEETRQAKKITIQTTELKRVDMSFNKRRMTEKKRFLLALAVIRVPFFVVFNLLTWPFRFLRNLLKLGTEFLLPLLNLFFVAFNLILMELTFNNAIKSIQKSGLSLHLLWQVPLVIIYGAINLAVGIAQYAISLACRIGLAFSSPLKSAWFAYNSGVQILGEENSKSPFSIFVGVLGFVMSMALSATLWAITLPLALGALVTAVPTLLTPINLLAQSPFIAKILAWLAELPFVAAASTAFNTAFGVAGAALSSTFGSAVGALGTLVSVTIPESVMALGLIMSVIVMPIVSFVTWGVEALSNVIMRWVEQRPFHTLFTMMGSLFSNESGTKVNAKHRKIPRVVHVHQLRLDGEIIVSDKACNLVTQVQEAGKETQKLADHLEVVSDWERKIVWNKAKTGNGYRFATRTEKAANPVDSLERISLAQPIPYPTKTEPSDSPPPVLV
jgi:hypothetical protein